MTDDVLEVAGDAAGVAVIELSFADGRTPVRFDTDASGRFDFTVTGLREGENTMSFAARPAGQPGRMAHVTARFTVRRGGSVTSSSVTCSGAISVTLNVDDAPDLRVQC